MSCTNLPVYLTTLNNDEIILCGSCIVQLSLNGNTVTQPNDNPITHSSCECPGCSKHQI